MEESIERYMGNLSRYLHLDSAGRDAIIEEVRGHLEEKTARYVASGMERSLAEQEAIKAFGKPRVLARRLSSLHPARWGVKRSLGAFLLGGVIGWALWTATAFPLAVNDEMLRVTYSGGAPSPVHVLTLSTPISTYGMYHLLHPWLLPVLLLYFALPFRWGMSARRWWLPGLAYGLGGVLTNPWSFTVLRQSTFVPTIFYTASFLVLTALPLAILASGLGFLWRLVSVNRIARHHIMMGQQVAGAALPPLRGQVATLLSKQDAAHRVAQRFISPVWVAVFLGLIILALQVFSFLRLWAVS